MRRDHINISSIKHVTGMDSPENIQRLMKLAPQSMYYTGFAQTEAMGVSRGAYTEKPGSAGRPSELTQVKLFDDLTMKCRLEPPVRFVSVHQRYFLVIGEKQKTQPTPSETDGITQGILDDSMKMAISGM